ncbi:MAG: peptidase domain-containing ABC transporter [Pseudomonadota bacterium]
MKVRPELQSEAQECGLACLAMVLSAYDRDVDLLSLRGLGLTSMRGLTLQDLVALSGQLGYLARGVRLEPERLASLRLPAILHWDMNHFVVLTRVGGRRAARVEIFDPALGRRQLNLTQVSEHFTGVALEVWPGESVRPVPTIPRFRLRDVWQMVGARWHPLASLIFLSLALQVLLLTGPWHLQWTVDEVLVSADGDLLVVLALGFAAVLSLRLLTGWMRGVLLLRVGHQLSFQLAARLFGHLLHLPVTWFERRHVGDVASRFASLQPLRDLFTQGASAMLIDLTVVVLALFAMLLYAPALAAVVIVVQLAYLLTFALLVPRLRRRSAQLVVAGANEQSQLLESLRGIVSIKVYGQEQHRYESWQREHARMLGHSIALQQQQLHLALCGQALTGLEYIAIVSYGARSVLSGDMTVGMLFAFVSYRGFFTDHMRNLVMQAQEWATIRVHLKRLSDIWSAPSEQPEGLAAPRRSYRGELALAEVSFAYDGLTSILRNAEMRLNAGEFVALIGPSGMGKTSVLKVLMGLHEAQAGALLVDGTPLTHATLGSYRGAMGCVLQEDQFFAGSVADNLARFAPVDMQRLEAALAAVGMHAAVERLPMKHLTRFGDIASCFSTGELQRLYLARALYAAPAYLFLDEVTANLDEESARPIRELVASLPCTRIAATHDLALARRADRILTLVDGRLVPRRL